MGLDLSAMEAKDHFDASAQLSILGLFMGSVGLVFLGLNTRDRARPLQEQ